MNAMLDDPTTHRVTVTVFDGTLAELPAISIKESVASCRDFRPDVIVGVGGSYIYKAKLVSLLLTHGAPLDRYYGEFEVSGPVIPVVAIPTTAGTGSEVTPAAVRGDGAGQQKREDCLGAADQRSTLQSRLRVARSIARIAQKDWRSRPSPAPSRPSWR